MSRLESCAEFARILLDDFESAERVCDSNSAINLTKHEMVIRRLNTHMEMDRDDITEIIGDMRAVHAHEQNETIKRIGETALEGGEITSQAAAAYYEAKAKAKVTVLDKLLERLKKA